MIKECCLCKSNIEKKSKQWVSQVYCSAKCRKVAHRKGKSSKNRIEQKRANLHQNDEVLYLIRQCKKAGTIQILDGHTLSSFIETMALIKNRPPGDVALCHIAPVKGKSSIGLFHYKNLFYGGAHQNRKFQNKYVSGGLSITHQMLRKKWSVTQATSNNDVLIKIEEYLGDIIPNYIKACPVRKSKKVQIATKILGIDQREKFDELMLCSYTHLVGRWASLTKIKAPVLPLSMESKYIAYMDSLSRFILYGGENKQLFKALRKIMVVGYMALERIEYSQTSNRYFYIKYEPLIQRKYGQAMLVNSADWSELKDFIYEAAFKVLQGSSLDIKKFRKKVFSYLMFPERAWKVKQSLS